MRGGLNLVCEGFEVFGTSYPREPEEDSCGRGPMKPRRSSGARELGRAKVGSLGAQGLDAQSSGHEKLVT